jgi:hypothetical protein
MTRGRMSAQLPENTPAPALTPLEVVVFVGGLAVAAVAAFPPPGLWKFAVPGVPAWTFPAAVVLALVLALVARRSPGTLEAPAVEAPGLTGSRRLALGLAVFIAAAAALWALRCQKLYGDGGAITGFVTQGVLFHKREPLSPTVFLLAQRSLGAALGWAPRETIQVVNTLAGALGIMALLGLARRIAGFARGPRVAASVALVGCGAVQLFAGYVENYTLPTVCMLGSLAFGLDALAGRGGLTRAFFLWTLACMFHLSGIVFLPAMLWLLFHAGWGGDLRRIPGAATLRVLGVTLGPALVLGALMAHFGFHRAEESGFGGGDGRMFVPLFAKEGMSQYLFFRAQHLSAIANQQMLVAPLGVLLVVTGTVGVLRRGRWRAWRAPSAAPGLGFDAQFYLGLVATGYLALTLIWNPDLGALRDWDLFGPVGFYLNLCGVALLARHFGAQPRRLTALLAFVAVVNLSRALPFLLHNAGL